MSKAKKIPTIKTSELTLIGQENFATFNMVGGIDSKTHEEFYKFLEGIYKSNAESAKALEDAAAKEKFNKVNDPAAKKEFVSIKPQIERINLVIDSYGGSTSAMLNIAALMDSSPIPIDTYCFGNAMSAAFFIFIHGKRRYANTISLFMTHNVGAGVFGTVPYIKNYALVLEWYENEVFKKIVSRTNLTFEKLKEWDHEDKFFKPEEAFAYGIIDSLVEG